MYASKPDKFLFIKSNKTAGTSLEIALTQCLSSRRDQFFTPLSFKDEKLRRRVSGVSFSDEMCKIFPVEKSRFGWFGPGVSEQLGLLSGFFLDDRSKKRFFYRRQINRFSRLSGFDTHATYGECLRKYSGFSQYWSCVFARHPYKRFLSHMAWQAKNFKNLNSWSAADWHGYARHSASKYCKRSLLHYAYDKKTNSFVSAILAFEFLDQGTQLVGKRLSLDPGSLAKAMPKTKNKSSSVLSRVDWAELLDSRVKSMILRSEEILFKEMGYQDSLDSFAPSRPFFFPEAL